MQNKPAWLIALWSLLPVVLGFIVIILASVAIVDFAWGTIITILGAWWLLFISYIVIVYLIIFLVMLSPLKTLSFFLLLLTFLFIIASPKNNLIAQQIRDYINSSFDLTYLFGGVTYLALAIAFISVYRWKNKN